MDPAAASATPTSTTTSSTKATERHAAPASTEIGEVIYAEHRRILRLFDALDNAARRGEAGRGQPTARHLWLRLADLLEQHTDAEEEVCFPALSGRDAQVTALMEAAIADHNDIREAVAEARLLETGSARWWRAVTAARDECAGHFRREERELLWALCGFLPHEAGRRAARQWEAFAAVRNQPDTAAAICAPVRVTTSATVTASRLRSCVWAAEP
jgi:hypothetical protein